MPSWLYKLICWGSFKTIHLRTKWDDKGITCIDCGHFKDKATYIADREAGGGW